MCALAAAGFAAYSINYTLGVPNDPATKWPAQWQDCECFLKFLAEQAGVSVPGNPGRIYIFGHSAGGHLAAMMTLVPHDAFPTNCSHTSTNYSVRATMLFSPPLDLRTLYMGSPAKGIQGGIFNLLGCVPSAWASDSCVDVAVSANPATYVAPGQPPILVETGQGDTNVMYHFQGSLQTSYAALSPPVVARWKVFPTAYTHDLDLFYFNPCSSNPEGPSPSPCGSAGKAYADLIAFFCSH